MNDTPTPPPADETPEQLRARIKELERRVAGLTFENDGLKAVAYPILMKDLPPDPPMTDDEWRALIDGPRTDSRVLWEIIEEYERKLPAGGGDGR